MPTFEQEYAALVAKHKDLALLHEVRLKMNASENDIQAYVFWRGHYDDLHEAYMRQFHIGLTR